MFRAGLILIFLVLFGCQTKSSQHQPHGSSIPHRVSSRVEKDAAPKGPLPTHFKPVHPKVEPLSRYGNPDTYTINGVAYDVMTSASGYKARGLASWYGTKFHAKRTSSGEHYDMYALTAAHRTLPLPTYARVKNLSNGKIIIVKINDRGPFHSRRIIDLSYGAAVKLGLFPRGTAMVEIEALNLQSRGQKQTAHYFLQAGAFQSSQFAYALKSKLNAYTRTPVLIENSQKKYIVKIGPFADKSDSELLKRTLQKKGIHGVFTVLQ